MSALIGVSSFRPLPQGAIKGIIYTGEGCLADDMPVVVHPTPNLRVEQGDQFIGSRLLVSLDDFPDVAQKRLQVLLRRFDQQLTVVFADVLAEEVEALCDVRDDCFLLREFQSSLPHERFHERFDFLFQQLLRGTGDDEVVRKSHQIHLRVALLV